MACAASTAHRALCELMDPPRARDAQWGSPSSLHLVPSKANSLGRAKTAWLAPTPLAQRRWSARLVPSALLWQRVQLSLALLARQVRTPPRLVQARAHHAHGVDTVLILGPLRRMCGRLALLAITMKILALLIFRLALGVLPGSQTQFQAAQAAVFAHPALLAPIPPVRATAAARCASPESIKTLQKQRHVRTA